MAELRGDSPRPSPAIASLFEILTSQPQPAVQTRKALLVIGAQNDLLHENGKRTAHNAAALTKRIAGLVTPFRDQGDIVWVRSEYAGDRLVNDASGAGDKVVNHIPRAPRAPPAVAAAPAPADAVTTTTDAESSTKPRPVRVVNIEDWPFPSYANQISGHELLSRSFHKKPAPFFMTRTDATVADSAGTTPATTSTSAASSSSLPSTSSSSSTSRLAAFAARPSTSSSTGIGAFAAKSPASSSGIAAFAAKSPASSSGIAAFAAQKPSNATATISKPAEAPADVEDELYLSNSPDAPACFLPGTFGSQYASPIQTLMRSTDTHFTKNSYSAFADPRLVMSLRCKRVTELYLCGALTNTCVYATALDAAQHGFTTYLVTDCLGYRTRGRHTVALQQAVDLACVQLAHSRNLRRAWLPMADDGEILDDADAADDEEDREEAEDMSSFLRSVRLGSRDMSPPSNLNRVQKRTLKRPTHRRLAATETEPFREVAGRDRPLSLESGVIMDQVE